MDDEPVAEPLDPSFFDFDVGEPLSKEELKGVYGLLLGSSFAYLLYDSSTDL